MQVSEDISLREYLHLLERRIKDPPCLDRYDEFLIKVWEFFALRATAEDNYSRNLHLAYSMERYPFHGSRCVILGVSLVRLNR